jgi:hypothetical protein
MTVSIANGVVAVAPKQIIAGTNVTTIETDTTVTINASGGGGGGGSIATGTTTLDFGATPGTNNLEVVITGQTTITGTSKCKAYLVATATAEHNITEHTIVPINITCGNIVAGTGFTIYASTDLRLTGTFNINWEWI